MHVVGAASRTRQQRCLKHVPIVERKHKIDVEGTDALQYGVGIRIVGRDARQAIVFSGAVHTVVPDGFRRMVCVRHYQRDLDAASEQGLQAAHADVVIGKDDSTIHSAVRFSGTTRSISLGSSRAWSDVTGSIVV